MDPKVSVVIPTLNGGKLFMDLLRKLARQVTDFRFETVVIDSGSTDGTDEIADGAGARVMRIPSREFNHGATRNKAIASCSGEYIVLMTQDAVPADDFLLAYLTRAFEDHSVAGVFARQSPRPNADLLTKRNLATWVTGRIEPELKSIASRERYKALSPMDSYLFCTFDNVCSAIRRSVWREHPLAEMNFGEDIEWSKRVLEAGWKIAYEPRAHVIHSHVRPVSYEYKRTYMCHRTLFKLFGLRTVPTRRHVVRSVLAATAADWKYVLGCSVRLQEKLPLMARIPALALASVYGQFKGPHDEIVGRGKAMRGV